MGLETEAERDTTGQGLSDAKTLRHEQVLTPRAGSQPKATAHASFS